MQSALIAALLVGATAPTVGVHLVQRRLSIIGDGVGHVALFGVALGLVTGWAPLGTAMATAVVGAIAVEALRGLRRNEVDVLMAILFAGGIAGGVVLISAMPPGRPANLDAYLFGAIITTTRSDLVVLAGTAAVVLAFTVGLCRALFAVSIDEECACAAGLPVTVLNMLLAATTAATVVASMRIVGLLLIGALMVLPAAAAMLLARSFRGTLLVAVGIGAVVASAGTTAAYYLGVPAGGTIVLLAVAVFTVSAAGPGVRRAARRVLASAGCRAAARRADRPRPVVHSRVGLLP
ncbi:metal ABC transporter permease [Blastococcus saxobsidens]|nr:metal ABC transporter permease [Blastococcus saxobsidens]